MIATTVNVLMFYGWVVYRMIVGAAQEVWRLKDLLAGPGLLAATVAFVRSGRKRVGTLVAGAVWCDRLSVLAVLRRSLSQGRRTLAED